jgi:peptidyl-prolyl cis-trans isomerase SurA
MRDPQLTNRLGDDATSPAQAQRKTAMLMERLKTGSDFAQLAMDYSEDPQTAQTGGDLGFIPASALEQVPPQLKDVVLKAQPGSVNVVSAGGGHTIVLLVAREPAGQRDLGTPGVRDGIRELLQERRTQLRRLAYITTARNGADIVNNLARQIVQAQAPPPGMTPAAPGGE